jgi:hypothetical protein
MLGVTERQEFMMSAIKFILAVALLASSIFVTGPAVAGASTGKWKYSPQQIRQGQRYQGYGHRNYQQYNRDRDHHYGQNRYHHYGQGQRYH